MFKLMRISTLMVKTFKKEFHKMKWPKLKNVMNKFQMKEMAQMKALKILNHNHTPNQMMMKMKKTKIKQIFHQKKERKFTKQEEKLKDN